MTAEKKKTPPFKSAVIVLALVLWALFFLPVLNRQVRESRAAFRRFHGLPLAEKERKYDVNFYPFIRMCAEKIPPRATLLFYTRLDDYRRIFPPGLADVSFEEHKQKAAYCLYPRRVYAGREEVPPEADYVVVFAGIHEFPGFAMAAGYSRDRYILERIK